MVKGWSDDFKNVFQRLRKLLKKTALLFLRDYVIQRHNFGGIRGIDPPKLFFYC